MSFQIKETSLFSRDFRRALQYIAGELGNPQAAARLLEEYERVADRVSRFPFAEPRYDGDRERKLEYRFAKVRNYLAFFTVSGETVTFRRFLYARSDLPSRLEYEQ